MHSGKPRKAREYYMNNETNEVYRVDAYGYDMDTNERRVVIRNLHDGKRWDCKESRLFEVKLIHGSPVNVWTKMPPDWHPVADEIPYPGYMNDPRKEVIKDGYNVYGISRNSTTSADSFNRRRIGFERR